MYPVLFSLGETPIHAYGFLIAVALILGWILSLQLARADKLPADQLGTGYVIAVGGGLLAARSMWLFQNPDQSEGIASLIQLQAGGLSGFGGVLAGLILAGVYCQNKKIPPWAWLDCAAPAFLIGVVLERVAAFLSGADFGYYVDPDFFLAVQFPADSPVYDIQRRILTGMRIPADLSLPVHPSQLYAAAAAAVGAGLTFVIRARRKYSGQVALFALGFYGATRYLIEDPFRYDMTPEIAGPVSLGQVTGVVIIGLVVGAHITRLKKLADDPQGLIQWKGGPWTPGADEGKKKSGKKSSGKKKSGKKSSGKKKAGNKTSGNKTSTAKKKSSGKKTEGSDDAGKSKASKKSD
ncbi:Prolipoprotein diacylglyceryl transferase [Enhygromyxa salina]|uniref:Prolipoprotein diacylglyceryl transferase n=1 Tax=Enhygromyxa salina TaxID=215803 RepID=A0A2S9XLP2_9BACT|nr:prolipoprotein diacylglyceryl transferase family protein [Enhygromyxa salina]PRP93796.1 Prolipoprotein diacylglyceryl transferase [Enhygromyxa salina]